MAAVEIGLLLLAAPFLLLVSVWATVTAYRILAPDTALPVDRTAQARRRGAVARVRARDIVSEQRRRPTAAFPSATTSSHDAESIAEALWARRN